jgi:hypothetical protein
MSKSLSMDRLHHNTGPAISNQQIPARILYRKQTNPVSDCHWREPGGIGSSCATCFEISLLSNEQQDVECLQAWYNPPRIDHRESGMIVRKGAFCEDSDACHESSS